MRWRSYRSTECPSSWDIVQVSTQCSPTFGNCFCARLQMICSYVLWPLAVVMGVDVADCRKVAEIIGTKTFLNEFVAYLDLSQLIGNRHRLERHVAVNGTWRWSGADVILTSLTSPGFNDTMLANGVITVIFYANCTYTPRRKTDTEAVATTTIRLQFDRATTIRRPALRP